MLERLSEQEIKLVENHFDISDGNETPLSIWVIGRPASGKTTVSTLLKHQLEQSGHQAVLIDGDDVRSILNGALGYSPSDRLSVFKKYVCISQLIQDKGIIPITATIGGFREFRDIVRKQIPNPRFIFLDCPFDVAAKRDQKGHYARAIAGELPNFFGIDISYEMPENYEIKFNSSKLNPTEITSQIVEHLKGEDLLKKIKY